LNQPLSEAASRQWAKLRQEIESFARALMVEMPIFAAATNQHTMLELAEQWLSKAIGLWKRYLSLVIIS